MSLIIVSGTSRSGTSMMMAMLQAGGIDIVDDDTVEANEFNPGGYFEHARALGGTWTSKDLKEWDGKAVKILKSLTKLPSNIDAKVIIMRRDMKASLASVDAIGKVRNWPESNGLVNRIETLDAIRRWSATRPHLEVWYEDVLRNPANECLRILGMLYPDADLSTPPIPLDLAAMAAIVDPKLNHHGESNL